MDTFKRDPFVELKLPQGHSGADMQTLGFYFLLSNQLRTQLTLNQR